MENKLYILSAKKFSGNASEEELIELEQLIGSHPGLLKEYEEFQNIWHESFSLRVNTTHNTTKAWEEFKILATKKRTSKKISSVVSLAAAVALIFTTVLLVIYFLPGKKQPLAEIKEVPVSPVIEPESPVLNTDSAVVEKPKKNTQKATRKLYHVVATDSAMVFLLPDSTKVYLNKYSGISYTSDFGRKDRLVELTGEAYFEVHHLPSPFMVTCGNSVTKDIGTAFNIKGSYNDSLVEVSVLSGSVVFYQKNKELNTTVLLSEGTGAIFNPSTSEIRKTKIKKSSKWWKSKGLKYRLREFIDKFTHKKN